jgi:hypothetical protein
MLERLQERTGALNTGLVVATNPVADVSPSGAIRMATDRCGWFGPRQRPANRGLCARSCSSRDDGKVRGPIALLGLGAYVAKL